MDPQSTLKRLRDRIYEEYLAASDSEIAFVMRIPSRVQALPWDGLLPITEKAETPLGVEARDVHTTRLGDDPFKESTPLIFKGRVHPSRLKRPFPEATPHLLKLLRVMDSRGMIEPADAWQALSSRLGFAEPVLHEIRIRDYLITREGDAAGLRRFCTHLRLLGRFIEGCRHRDTSVVLPPSDLLNFALMCASEECDDFLLRAGAFFFPRNGEFQLVRVDRKLSNDVVIRSLQGELDWPEDDYFFVLEGDARLAIVEFIDAYLASRPSQAEGGCLPLRIPDGSLPSLALPALDPAPPDESREMKPRWDAENRKLWYGVTLCRDYKRRGDTQFTLLDVFEAEDWPDSISDPFDCDRQMRQTIDDLNKELDHNRSPIRFRAVSGRPSWYERDLD